MANTVLGLVDALALVVGAVGIGVLLCGTYATAVRLIGSQISAGGRPEPGTEQEATRLQFGPYLLLGLDFIIAAGAIKTLVHADWQQVAVLGGMVLIRAVAGISLHWEMARTPAARELAVPGERSLPAPPNVNGWPVAPERPAEVPGEAGR
jgi:uncharacterized membrane protein